jgi:putative FmdB family regulatory protein
MPIYEYRCENGHLFEVMQRMTEDAITECEVCGAPCQRVLHPVAVHFKGKGFYNTDYGTRKRQRELKAAGEGTSSSSDGGGESSSGDAKSSDSGSSSSSKSESSSSGSSSSSSSASGSKKSGGSSSS